MTRPHPIYREPIITDFDGVWNFIFDDELIVPFDGTEVMFEIVKPWLTEFISVMSERLEIATHERGFNVLILFLFEELSKRLKPKNMLHWLDRQPYRFEVFFKFPSIQFHFFSVSWSPYSGTFRLKIKLEITVINVEKHPEIDFVSFQ